MVAGARWLDYSSLPLRDTAALETELRAALESPDKCKVEFEPSVSDIAQNPTKEGGEESDSEETERKHRREIAGLEEERWQQQERAEELARARVLDSLPTRHRPMRSRDATGRHRPARARRRVTASATARCACP